MWILTILFIIIIFSIIGFFSSTTKNEEKKDKKFQELDEELEDYDYLDDITGRDDKWWI